MTTTTPEAPDEDSGGGSRVEMHAASHDFSAFTQIGIQNIKQLPLEAFRPWAETAAPPGLGNVPARPGLFVGRARELARLDAALAGPGGVVVQAVHGLGGIGKSTLAAYWAVAHASDYTLTWWITAATPADIDAGLASLAVALQPALSGALPLEALREGAVQWLAAHRGWLVVLDNVTDPADVAPLLARAPAGRYLITSRLASGWHRTAVPVRLDVLAPAEAQALLAAILTQDRPRELEGTAELSAELGFLPLAIEQAGAYIAETGITPTEYLDLLARYPADMYAQTAEGGDDQRTIGRIWHVTLDRLAGDPLAGQVLRILAWYAPEAIPRALLDGLTDPPALLHAVGRLAAYSMLTADGGTLAVHLLVQAVTRTPDPGDPHRSPQAIDDARAQATALLADAATPWEDPAGWPTWRALLPHVEALARNTSSTSSATDTPSTANLLSQAAAFMEDQGALARAIPLYERALAACLRLLGEDNVHALDARSNVAYAYAKAGDLSRAIPLLEANLQDRARVLGEDHPDTLASRSKLAFAYEVAGHLARAKPLYQSAYDDCLRVLGPDHSQTLTALKNVAYAYQTDGDLARAIPLFERALAACLRVLGEDNVHTLEARNNVASAYLTAGNLSRAIPLYESAYAGCLRVLGENHPGTLATRGNLADAYLKAGDLDRAIPVYENAYADCLRVLGPDHSHTLVACRDLAFAYAAADDLIKAIPMLEQTLDGYRRVLGEKHPDTLGTRVNLATFYSNAGYLDRAMQMYKNAYGDCLLALGPNHPHTLIARSSLDSMNPGSPSYLGPGGIGFWTSGKPAAPPVEFGPGTEDLVEALRDVIDPELGVDVVDLGLVYDVTVGPDRIATIDMTLTGADTYIDVIEDQTRAALEGLVSELRINWVWTPPWGPDKITEDGRDMLRALGFNG